MLRIDPSDAIPIWKQIEEGVQHLVATGTLGPDDAVASVRELARELRVNPLTVSKAFQFLIDAGLVESRRGMGNFVLPGATQKARTLARERFLAETWPHVAKRIEQLGLSVPDLLKERDA